MNNSEHHMNIENVPPGNTEPDDDVEALRTEVERLRAEYDISLKIK